MNREKTQKMMKMWIELISCLPKCGIFPIETIQDASKWFMTTLVSRHSQAISQNFNGEYIVCELARLTNYVNGAPFYLPFRYLTFPNHLLIVIKHFAN